MSKAFAPAARLGTCALGSVKANLGHLDAAAGVIGFIKAALSLHDSVLVPAPNFEQPNPKIELGRTPFYVNRKLQPWSSGTRPGVPRRAGVSSFGMGGTNAHVILQEAPAAANVPSPRSAQLIVLSARTEQALEDSTRQLAEHLQERPDLDLADVAHTLQVGRGVFAHRRTVVGRTAGDVAQALGTLDPARVRTSAYDGATSHVAFMFPGQGAQYAGMCAGIYRAFPVFAEAFDECCAQLRAHLDRDLRNIVFAPDSEREQSSLVLQRTEYAQPVLFAIEYSLARLWMSWGVTPAACIGHSVGEYVAACIGGVLPFRDAIRIVAGRGRLMQELPEGAMTAVFLPAHELAEWLVPPLELAALNGPRVAVVAGPLEAMASFERTCAERTIETRRLRTSHAFHSAAMEPILAKFLDLFSGVNLSAPKVPFVSNLTGTWITAAEARSPRYWAAHLRQPVRFSEGVRALAQKDNPVLLEVGPGRTLSSLAIQNVPSSTTLASVPQSGEETSDVEQLLDTAGHLWRRGRAIDWSRFSEGESRRRVSLPTYPFQRQRYWLEPSPVEEPKPVVEGIEEKFAEIGRWFYLPEWRQTPPPHFYAGGRVEAADSTWLLFVEPTEFCGAVVQRLETLADPARMFVVSAGDRFEQSGARQFTINPRRREDYLSLVRALDGVGALPHVVAHLWATARLADGDVVEAQYRGFYSLTFLTQALRNVAGDALRPTRIQIVGRGMFDVAGSEQLEPGKVTAVAACRVLSREQPELTCRAIDVDATDANAVRTVVDELRLQAPDSMIAYRGGRRWTPLIEPIGLPQEVGNAAPLREKGCYLIAGGFGAIGSVLARHLAQTVGAKLVLLSRVPVPEGDARSRWLDTHTEHDATSARIRFVRDLERMGADVLVAVADVADIDAMNAARDAVIARFGEINGVVFAAGLAGAGAVQAPDAARSGSVLVPVAEVTESSANAQFRPKLQGLPVLEQVLGDRPLDFCLIVSSLSSVIPGPGYATYAAANAFMDAFVHHHNQRSAVRWLTVNWDAWSFGAAAETALGRVTITEAEGVDVFRRVLGAAGLGHIIVSTLNLHARAASAAKPAEAAAPERKLYSRPESLQASFEAPLTPVEETVSQVWQQVLGIDRVGRRDNFFQLGGHSLLAVQVVARLEDILHVEVPMRHVFDAATVSDLAARIEAALMGASVYSARLNDETADVEELEI